MKFRTEFHVLDTYMHVNSARMPPSHTVLTALLIATSYTSYMMRNLLFFVHIFRDSINRNRERKIDALDLFSAHQVVSQFTTFPKINFNYNYAFLHTEKRSIYKMWFFTHSILIQTRKFSNWKRTKKLAFFCKFWVVKITRAIKTTLTRCARCTRNTKYTHVLASRHPKITIHKYQ